MRGGVRRCEEDRQVQGSEVTCEGSEVRGQGSEVRVQGSEVRGQGLPLVLSRILWMMTGYFVILWVTSRMHSWTP